MRGSAPVLPCDEGWVPWGQTRPRPGGRVVEKLDRCPPGRLEHRPHPHLAEIQGRPGPFRVAVVDDEEGVRVSLKYIFAASDVFRLDGSYRCGTEALERIAHTPPDVVLMDIRLPDVDGIRCTRLLKRAYPQMHVVMMSGLEDAETVRRAAEAGCGAYLTKPFSPAQCFATLNCVLSLGPVGSRPAQAEPRDGMPVCSGPGCRPSLSKRELEVFERLGEGMRYKEVAAQLDLSASLVSKLAQRVFRKLHAHSRTEAVNRWHGYTTGPTDH
jgi:DNA-binding NarL/FixJ family response regulator